MVEIWNEVVEADDAFPQSKCFSLEEARTFFASQSRTLVAVDNTTVLGLAIIHPNGFGHLAENANASYAVTKTARGKGIGERLVKASLRTAKEMGFHNLQFNAVLASNTAAIRLYEKLGFTPLGILREGYRHNDGNYEDLRLFFHSL